MDDQYGGLADLRQYMNGVRTHFTAIPPPPPQPVDLFSGGRNLTLESQNNHHHHHHHHNNPYDMVMGRAAVVDLVRPHQGGILDLHHHHHHEFPSDSTGGGGGAAAASSGASLNGLEMDGGGGGGGVGFGDVGGGSGRWPRQETLTLLEIRSRLDSKFKEANQKGPLWDEVSRIMSEEHGYQRSGKKCREKFENLYKYYKKTKEGKAGRQDGKHYRFFRQLEALYGDHTTPISTSEAHLMGNDFHFHNPNNSNITQANQESFFQAPKHCDSHSLSLSNSSEFDTSSSDGNEMNKKKRGGRRRSWKSKIKEFIDIQMRKLMEKQEEWLEKMTKTLERKEQERVVREEEWRQQERERVEREHKFWANERAWIEARDAALMEALHKLTGKEVVKGDQEVHRNENGSETISNAHWRGESWPESEVAKMIELRVSMESRFEQSGCSEEVVWEEIAAKMGCFGYERSGLMCKEKWDRINSYIGKTNKKRKENYSRGSCYYQGNEGFYNNQGEGGGYCEIVNEQRPAEIITRIVASDHGSSTPNSNAGNAIPDSCFRFLVGSSDDHGENLWQNYSHVKLGKGGN
ncbi:hypothetical protein Vadar_018001 [Vaccinium darrowii]|uniref:Uncharacterized protein n=1 Tax=Vaccinium darrowii TaxID=229202 RepID=A0ACB7YN68_9ERIC|nr:hypothetical protein Vadar_018001 [Vaccinium darrowii]